MNGREDPLDSELLPSSHLLIGTGNSGKLKELCALLADAPFELISLADAGIDHDVDETGATFEENAALKAETYCRLSGLPVLADDSGLEVDALGGEPGVRSARYAGDDADDALRIEFLLDKLSGTPPEQRRARFRCVVAIALPLRQDSPELSRRAHGKFLRQAQDPSSERVELHKGECLGEIIDTPRGSSGFGYDPVFFLQSFGKTMAELSPDEKNKVSHRSIAARKAAASLRAMAATQANRVP